MEIKTDYLALLGEHNSLFFHVDKLKDIVEQTGQLMAKAIQMGNKILICGNGGSAADAQHFAAEIVGRFEKERLSWPAIAITTDTSILTALGNDYGYDSIFSRQVEGLGKRGDLLVGISTSGNSGNVVNAVSKARSMGIETIGLLGRDGGKLAKLMDYPVVVPHEVTARIQEVHIFIVHFWASLIENEIVG